MKFELNNLPDIRSQEVQSYALTTATLVRYIIQDLGVEELEVRDPYDPKTKSHRLSSILSSLIHFNSFYPPIRNMGKEANEFVFKLYSEGAKRKGIIYFIRLDDYFELVDRIARDDLLMARYLLRRTIRLLRKAINAQITLDSDFLEKVNRLTQDALELASKLSKDSVIELPVEVHVDLCEGSLRPGSQWDLIFDYSSTQICVDFVYGFGTRWKIEPFTPQKRQIGDAQAFCFGIEKIDPQDESLPKSISVVPFDSFLRMFEEIHLR